MAAKKKTMARKKTKGSKTLKIIFSGISTLSPGPPRTGEKHPDKAFVRMAANEKAFKNDWDATVPPHFPFVFVPVSALVEPIPKPYRWVRDNALGKCNIYVLKSARVTVEPHSKDELEYHIEKRPLGERPGSDDIAGEHDIRWLADIRDHVKAAQATPKSDAHAPGPEVAVIVDLTGGTLKAEFPCKSVQAQTFKAAKSDTISGMKRVLANEFSVEMSYPKKTRHVKLKLIPLRTHSDPTGIAGNELILQWPDKGELIVRMGNDTLPEAKLAASPKRCNARVRSVKEKRPVVKPRDDDFFLHYNLLNVSANAPRPLPQAGPHQTSGDGCKPAVVKGNP
jgi:hypothetical protein